MNSQSCSNGDNRSSVISFQFKIGSQVGVALDDRFLHLKQLENNMYQLINTSKYINDAIQHNKEDMMKEVSIFNHNLLQKEPETRKLIKNVTVTITNLQSILQDLDEYDIDHHTQKTITMQQLKQSVSTSNHNETMRERLEKNENRTEELQRDKEINVIQSEQLRKECQELLIEKEEVRKLKKEWKKMMDDNKEQSTKLDKNESVLKAHHKQLVEIHKSLTERKRELHKKAKQIKMRECCTALLVQMVCNEYGLDPYKFYRMYKCMDRWIEFLDRDNSMSVQYIDYNKITPTTKPEITTSSTDSHSSVNNMCLLSDDDETKYIEEEETNHDIIRKYERIKWKINRMDSCKSDKCEYIVYGFIRKIGMIPDDIINLCFIFYHQYTLKLENPDKTSPFMLLFATYHLWTALSIGKWQEFNNEIQCQYLQDRNIRKTFKNINMDKQFRMILITFDEENKSLTSNVCEWSQHDVIISFMNHLIYKETKKIQNNSTTWEFVEYLRRYFKLKLYDGAKFCRDNASIIHHGTQFLRV